MQLQFRFNPDEIDKALLKNGTEGNYFEKFCSELFEKLDKHSSYSSRNGRDGGIDGCFEDGHGLAFWDAKYVGKDNDKDIENRWKEVASLFKKNLLPERPKLTQYQPWYSQEEPVKSYYFCVSARFANLSCRNELQSEIETFFKTLSEGDGLGHLASLNVHVWDWDDFDRILRDHPKLILRWFPAQRPNGWTPIESVNKVSGFEAFLHSTVLPYYSLAQHKEKEPNPAVLDEDGWLAEFEKDSWNGYIITGAGGIGKTRLMYELGERADQHGWNVLVASNRETLNIAELGGMVCQSDGKQKLLLLIDYAETRSNFRQLQDEVTELNHGGYVIRTLATSRHTSVRRVGGHLDGVRVIEMSPADQREWFERYRRAVTEHILSRTEQGISAQTIGEFSETPVLAAFAFYLHKFGYSQNQNLDALLGQSQFKFEKYLERRVDASFPESRDAIEDVTRILAQLPFEDATVNTLNPVQSKVWKALNSDRWVDFRENSGRWYAVHDLFADTLLQSHFRNIYTHRPSDLNRELVALFDVSLQLGTTTSCLTAIERVRAAIGLRDTKWDQFFRDQIQKNTQGWSGSRVALLRSPLVAAHAKLGQIHDLSDFWTGVEHEPGYDLAVMNIGEEWAARREQHPANWDTLTDLYVRGINTQAGDNKLATHALRTLPPGSVADSIVLGLIKREARALQDDFPLVAWLDSNRPVKDVEAVAGTWINQFGETYNASYLIVSLLNASRGSTILLPVIEKWLQKYKNRPSAGIVLGAWIKHSGDIAPFETQTADWLRENYLEISAGHLYEAWLNAGKDISDVEEQIKKWLGEHELNAYAGFVYEAWLDARGNISIVKRSIRLWIKEHYGKIYAGFVYKSWLDAGGNKAAVKESIRSWLVEHGKEKVAQSVYKSWLDAGGEIDVVKEPIRLWLEAHQEAEVAQFVYKSWLDAGGNIDVVEKPIRLWLGAHQEAEVAQFVYKSWLGAGGDKDVVEKPIQLWLVEYQQKRVAKFVYEAWLKIGGDIVLIKEPVQLWLEKNGQSDDATYVYSRLITAADGRTLITPYINNWFSKKLYDADAQYTLSAWLQHAGNPDLVQGAVLSWLSLHATREQMKTWCVLKDWLSHGGSPAAISSYVTGWLAPNATRSHAVQIISAWKKAGGDPSAVTLFERPIHPRCPARDEIILALKKRAHQDTHSEEDLLWIAEQCSRIDVKSDIEVLWCFPRFTVATFQTPSGQQLLEALIEAITFHVTHQGPDDHLVKHLSRQLCFLVECFDCLTHTPQSRRIKQALLIWIRNNKAFCEKTPSNAAPVRRLLEEIAILTATGELDEESDGKALERVFAWTARCSSGKIADAQEVLGKYSAIYPEKSAIWNLWCDKLSFFDMNLANKIAPFL